MTAQEEQQAFLPKEPIDLPKEPLDIPAHATSQEPTYNSVKTLLAWKAPGRPFRKRQKEYYLNSMLITFLLLVILFLFSQYLLMVVVVSLLFVSFALNSVPPHDFHYRISSEGITIEDHFFLWEELYDFYFKRREGQDVAHIRTRAFLPGELTLTLGDVSRVHLQSVLLPYLPYREVVKPTFMEKAGDWLSQNFPLERLSS